MYIRWSLNSKIYITNSESFDLGPICFKYKEDYDCEISFEVEPGSTKDFGFHNKIKSIVFILKSENSSKLEGLYNNDSKMAKELIKVSNIFLKAIRVIGQCHTVHEFSLKKHIGRYFFEKLELKFSEDGSNEVNRINEPIFYHLQPLDYVNHLPYDRWREVINYIDYEVEIPPELEFLINAYEHYDKLNNRFAVLEATIGLEISLSRFLKSYLSHRKLPDERIKNFLGPDIGLTSRVSILLPLIVDEELLSIIDLDKVLNLIKWRNKIVHSTGNMPGGVGDEMFLDSFKNVARLIKLLSNENKRLQ